MDKQFAIFDMDGTLVDSMVYWQHLGRRYLEAKGIQDNLEAIIARIKTMTMAESAALFIEEFHLPDTVTTVVNEMNGMMDNDYQKNIPLKPGVENYLDSLQQRGVTMCVASATARPLMSACLKRLGVLGYFSFLLSCESIGTGKSQPDIYHAAARRLGAAPADIAVYEDALYALRTAKAAGYYVIGVYDDSAASEWPEICRLADEVMPGWPKRV